MCGRHDMSLLQRDVRSAWPSGRGDLQTTAPGLVIAATSRPRHPALRAIDRCSRDPIPSPLPERVKRKGTRIHGFRIGCAAAPPRGYNPVPRRGTTG